MSATFPWQGLFPWETVFPWQNVAMRNRRHATVAALIAMVLVVAGCGGGASTASLTPTPSPTPLVTGALTWSPCPTSDRIIGGNEELL